MLFVFKSHQLFPYLLPHYMPNKMRLQMRINLGDHVLSVDIFMANTYISLGDHVLYRHIHGNTCICVQLLYIFP